MEKEIITLITSYESVQAIGWVKCIRFKIVDNNNKCIYFKKIQFNNKTAKFVRLFDNYETLIDEVKPHKDNKMSYESALQTINYFQRNVEILEKLD